MDSAGSVGEADSSNWHPSASREWSVRATQAAFGMCVIGIILRTRELLHNRSLWRDEASLVYNLRHRDLFGFTTPLDHDQGTPPGFFVLSKVVGATLGGSEIAYRTVPFIASSGALLLAVVLVRRWLPPLSGVVTVAVLALSPTLVYYAAEVKQYAVDLAVALLLLLTADEVLRRRFSIAACLSFAAVGAAAVLTAYPSVFVLPVVGIAVAVSAWPDRRALTRLVMVGAVWATVFVTSYLAWTRHLNDSDFLRDFWADGFLPVPPLTGQDLDQWGRALRTFYVQLLAPGILGVAAALSALGLVQLARHNRTLLAVVVAPFVLVIAASSLERYPAIERSVIFLLPLVAVTIGAGCEVLGDLYRNRPGGRWLPALLLLVLAAAPAADRMVRPPELEELRPLLDEMNGAMDGDTVLVTTTAFVAWDYYADRLQLRPRQVIEVSRSGRGIDLTVDRAREPTVWVVDVAFWLTSPPLSPDLIDAMDAAGARLREDHERGASVYLYDLSS